MTQPQLKLYNALTREKEVFTPLDPTNVRMYTCGITPYDFAHIGNLRTMVVFDVMFRLLRQVYGENHVTYARNYTDIDDKIVERAALEGKEPFALAAEFIAIFERDMHALNLLEPTEKPRVSQHMQGIATMVDKLIEKGFAYITASGDVMYSVPAFEQLPNPPHHKFGYLARRTFDKLQARVEEDAEKQDPRDFPVWKANAKSATKLEQAFDPKTLGAKLFTAPGRPGWHIECSVMSEALLGQNYKPGDAALFDIHGGGEDLAFPHHSCEIAQTEALHPTCTMSSIWMHAAFLTVDGQKMSKSLNNFLRVEDALKKYSPEAIRLWLLQTHYRKPVDFSDEALQSAQQAYQRLQRIFDEPEIVGIADPSVMDEFMFALQDDLNTANALAILNRTITDFNKSRDASNDNISLKVAISKMSETLGLKIISLNLESWEIDEIEGILDIRRVARANKKWAESDALREELKNDYGILVEDGPTGQTWRRL